MMKNKKQQEKRIDLLCKARKISGIGVLIALLLFFMIDDMNLGSGILLLLIGIWGACDSIEEFITKKSLYSSGNEVTGTHAQILSCAYLIISVFMILLGFALLISFSLG